MLFVKPRFPCHFSTQFFVWSFSHHTVCLWCGRVMFRTHYLRCAADPLHVVPYATGELQGNRLRDI